MNGVSTCLAICACVVVNTGRASAEGVQLTYEDRIVMCTALHTADPFVDYPIALQAEPAIAFQAEFERLTGQGLETEILFADKLEDTVRSFMFILNYSDANLEQKTAMQEQVMAICDDTFEDMHAGGTD